MTTDDKGRMQLQSLTAAVVRRQRVTGSEAPSAKEPSVAELTKALIHFIASKLVQYIESTTHLTRPLVPHPHSYFQKVSALLAIRGHNAHRLDDPFGRPDRCVPAARRVGFCPLPSPCAPRQEVGAVGLAVGALLLLQALRRQVAADIQVRPNT